MGECRHDYLDRVLAGDPADGNCALCDRQKIADLQAKLADWEDAGKEWCVNREKLRAKHAKAILERERYSEALEQAEAKLEQVHTFTIPQLKNEIADLNAELERADADGVALQDTIDALTDKLEQAEARVDTEANEAIWALSERLRSVRFILAGLPAAYPGVGLERSTVRCRGIELIDATIAENKAAILSAENAKKR